MKRMITGVAALALLMSCAPKSNASSEGDADKADSAEPANEAVKIDTSANAVVNASAIDATFSELYGEGIAKNMVASAAADNTYSLVADEFVRGVEQAMDAAADDKLMSYNRGTQYGEQIVRELSTYEKAYGIHIDKAKLIASLKKHLANGNVSKADIDAVNEKVRTLLTAAANEKAQTAPAEQKK